MCRLLIAVLMLASAGLAHAEPCPVDFQHPTKATQLKSSFVQAFVACNDQFTGQVPNATTETGTVPSCYPAETWNENAGTLTDGWLWGPKSKGSIQLKAGKNALVGLGYEQNIDPEAVDLFVDVKLSDVRDQNGIADGPDGSLALTLRVTLIDRANGGDLMTIIDFPFSASLPIQHGKARRRTSLSAILDGIEQTALPRCASIEVLSVQVTDPNGIPFAVMGIYLP